MANLEKRLELEQGSSAMRTLSPDALRVILRLTSSGKEPLTRERSYQFNRILRGDKEFDYLLTYKEGAYFLDFNALDGDEADTNLARAVGATDKALLTTQLPAEVSAAWTMPIDGPRVGQVTTDWKESATEVTGSAQEMFANHRIEFIEASAQLIEGTFNYDRLLYQS